MLVSEIMTAVRDIVTVSDDDELKRRIAAAARDYSRYQPERSLTTIETVDDQEEYDLPANTICVTDVCWYPAGNVIDAHSLITPIRSRPTSAPDDPANRLIDAISKASDEDAVRGDWRYVNDRLWLHPTPASDALEVYVWYVTAHVSSGSGETLAYATIPDRHFDAMVKLTAASVLQAQASVRANQFDYTEGLTKTVKSHIPGNLVRLAQQYRAEALGVIR